jgi:hypothetical protein
VYKIDGELILCRERACCLQTERWGAGAFYPPGRYMFCRCGWFASADCYCKLLQKNCLWPLLQRRLSLLLLAQTFNVNLDALKILQMQVNLGFFA